LEEKFTEKIFGHAKTLRKSRAYQKITSPRRLRLRNRATAKIQASAVYAGSFRKLFLRMRPDSDGCAKNIQLRKVASGEFGKKADNGKWFGSKAKNQQQKGYHNPPEAER
jgi:hypothetical protein